MIVHSVLHDREITVLHTFVTPKPFSNQLGLGKLLLVDSNHQNNRSEKRTF